MYESDSNAIGHSDNIDAIVAVRRLSTLSLRRQACEHVSARLARMKLHTPEGRKFTVYVQMMLVSAFDVFNQLKRCIGEIFSL